MSLSRALQIAQEELKSTNSAAKADKFYCLSAKVVGASTKDGAWSFQFASKRVKYGLQKLRSMAMYSFIRLETMLKIGACRPNKVLRAQIRKMTVPLSAAGSFFNRQHTNARQQLSITHYHFGKWLT
jgi:hypothetical protein